METKDIKALILDLGDVIVKIDQERTKRGIACFMDAARFQEQSLHPLFQDIARYETGSLESEEFLASLQGFLHRMNPALPQGYPARQTLVDIWNAMIAGLPVAHLELLGKIRRHYGLYLLSNTNALHVEFLQRLLPEGFPPFESFFDQVFYSYALKMHKPETHIYQHVCEHIGMPPGECLFIDDRAENIEGARKAGLQAFQLTDFNLPSLFDEEGRLKPEAHATKNPAP